MTCYDCSYVSDIEGRYCSLKNRGKCNCVCFVFSGTDGSLVVEPYWGFTALLCSERCRVGSVG